MKLALAKIVLGVAIMTLVVPPALARHPREWIPSVVGQEVYNLKNTRVGRVERYIDVRGTPGVIIRNDAPGGRTVVAQAQDLGRRDAGGLLLVLSDRGVADLPTYQPGRLPFF